jgi:hypothetical protein
MLNSKGSSHNTDAAKAFALPSLSDPFFDQFLAGIPESSQGSLNT